MIPYCVYHFFFICLRTSCCSSSISLKCYLVISKSYIYSGLIHCCFSNAVMTVFPFFVLGVSVIIIE